jgi:hypothetical protein
MSKDSPVIKFLKGLLRNFATLLTMFLAIRFFNQGVIWASFLLGCIFIALIILRYREDKSARENNQR